MNNNNIINILDIDLAKTYLIDVRTSEDFIQGFIPNSLSMPVAKIQKNAVLLENTGLNWTLIGNAEEVNEAAEILEKLFPKVILQKAPNALAEWQSRGKELDMIIQVEADEYAMDAPFDEKLVLVDVRSEADYEKMHAENAVSMPLPSLTDLINIASIEDGSNVYLHCGGGSSAIIAASMFKNQGFHSLRIIEGGIKAMQEESKIVMIANKKTKPKDEEA